MRFRPDRTFERELRATAEFKTSMAATTVVIAGFVQAAAEPFRATGYYVRRIKARGSTIRFEDVFWHLSEYGSINNVPQRNALRGVRAAGLRFEDHRAALQ